MDKIFDTIKDENVLGFKEIIRSALSARLNKEVEALDHEAIESMGMHYQVTESKKIKEDDDDDDEDDECDDDKDDDDEQDDDDDESLNEGVRFNSLISRYSFSPATLTQFKNTYPKHPIIPKAKADKFVKGVISKINQYLKKDFKGRPTHEFEDNVVKGFEEKLKKIVINYGSIPVLNSHKFMTDAGDPYTDLFPTYSVSYKTMEQIEEACYTVAVRQGLIPDEYNEKLKEMVDEKFKEYFDKSFYDCSMRYTYDVETLMTNCVTFAQILDSEETFARFLAGGIDMEITDSQRLNKKKAFISDVYKETLKILKI